MKLDETYREDCLATLGRMEDETVDLIVTSPPYNKGFWSSNRNLNNGFATKSRRIEYEGFNDCLPPEEYEAWQREVIGECLRVLKPTGSFFYNHQPIQKQHQEIFPTFVFDFPLKQTLVWDRSSTPKIDPSYFFPTIEFVFWFQKTASSRVRFDRKKGLYDCAVWGITPERRNNHPAPFPLDLPLNCILTCTNEGDVVYDPFMGSGTTARACKQTGRRYVGSEVGDYVGTDLGADSGQSVMGFM